MVNSLCHAGPVNIPLELSIRKRKERHGPLSKHAFMQYAAIFNGCKNDYVPLKIPIFSYFFSKTYIVGTR